jgi:hypothetical protein
MSKVTRTTRDMLRPLTEDERQQLEALKANPDSEIDYSDIP